MSRDYTNRTQQQQQQKLYMARNAQLQQEMNALQSQLWHTSKYSVPAAAPAAGSAIGTMAVNNKNNYTNSEDKMLRTSASAKALLARSPSRLAMAINYSNGGRGNTMLVSLTCLQFAFAIYVTFLLFLVSPSLDIIRHGRTSLPTARTSLFVTSGDHLGKPSQKERMLLLQDHHEAPAAVVANGSSGSISISSISSIRISNTSNAIFDLDGGANSADLADYCEQETIDFEQKRSNDTKMLKLKTDFFREIVNFQHGRRGCETLKELMAMPSKWDVSAGRPQPKVLAVLNHYKRRTLCAQLDALLRQTISVYAIWIVAFSSPNEAKLRRIADSYNDSRISFLSSTYDFKYYGRFQVALQAESVDFIYVLDDDMIPGRKMLRILTHTAGTDKYSNSVLGSIGRILPFRQIDLSFPSYRKYGVKEAGLYLPDPAYGIQVNRIVQVDFLSSSWFLSSDLVKTLFIETPFTFATGEDLHLSYQLQKYRGAGSYVVPINAADRDSWGDSEHRLAQIAETTVIFKEVVEVRDEQWWRALSKGYVTQWAAMNPQESDAIFYAHTTAEVRALAPLLNKYKQQQAGKRAFLAVAGGESCPCEAAARILGWNANASCRDRRFRIFDLHLGSIARSHHRSHVSLFQELFAAVRGLLRIHNPALLAAVSSTPKPVTDALALAATRHAANASTAFLLLPLTSVVHALWIPDVDRQALRNWQRMRISINVITQNRAYSLKRLLASLQDAHYVGDDVTLTFNMDSQVDEETLRAVEAFEWGQGRKVVRRRIIQGGLIRAVSESWYPSHDHDYGLLLEDDIEVSPFFYMWIKACLLHYRYTGPPDNLPELSSIALYSPRLIEVLKERPKWNATDFFHSNTPYLHQLPCSWGALFFPKHWREFYVYMGSRFTEDAKNNTVQIPKSRTNGWQASWKKFLIDMMYLRGYVALYPNFPDQHSFSTNHMEPGAHISAAGNVVKHNPEDFVVPLLTRPDFWDILPHGRLPPAKQLPVLDLFNRPASLESLKLAGALLAQDVLPCPDRHVVHVDHATGAPLGCMPITN